MLTGSNSLCLGSGVRGASAPQSACETIHVYGSSLQDQQLMAQQRLKDSQQALESTEQQLVAAQQQLGRALAEAADAQEQLVALEQRRRPAAEPSPDAAEASEQVHAHRTCAWDL